MAIVPSQYPLLIAAPMLQDYFVNKDTGTPLAGGIVTFYQDNARTILKNVYYQTGTPGHYSYIPLPNPMTLTAVGTISDEFGNDQIPFFFPYNELDDDELQPYFITVYSANQDGSPAVLQFTRENFPFITQQNINPIVTTQDLVNLISNGQFPAHNNLPNAGLFPNGSSSVTAAQGGSAGWYFTKNNTSTDTDFITFTQILEEPNGLTGNPRFAITIQCATTSGHDTFKELRYRFNNVNRFASNIQNYTFSFTGQSNAASPVTVSFNIIKFFGTGGSATSETIVQTYILPSNQYTQFSTTFFFGVNNADTIGTLNDDYVEVVIAFPAASTFSVNLSDFILTPGMVNFTSYPERPDNMVFADALTGSLPTPNPNGADLYLPVVVTQAGATYDTSVLGQIMGSINTTPGGPWLLCDGSTFLTLGYSSLGIPYSRIQNLLTTTNPATNGIPLYGTGSTFATQYNFNSITNTARISTNQGGAQTAAADGSIATGFTFGVIHTGQTIALNAYTFSTSAFTAIATTTGLVPNATAGTSGFTVSLVTNTTLSYVQFSFVTLAGSAITGGNYFTFSVPGTNYYCWYKVNGVGADPAPGGTGIQVNILSTYTAAEVAQVTREAVGGFQISSITYNAASTITPGAFFTFNANGTTYSIWYKVGGSGSAPNVGTPIQVTLAGTETNTQVATLTAKAINNYSFGVPDFRGMFLRSVRGSGQFNINAGTRYSDVSGVFGNAIGTFETDTFQIHTHALTGSNPSVGAGSTAFSTVSSTTPTGSFTPANLTVNNTGQPETQPVNANVYWYIRY